MVSTVSRLPASGSIDQAGVAVWIDYLQARRPSTAIIKIRRALELLQDQLARQDGGGDRLLAQLQVADILDQLELDVDILVAGLLCGVTGGSGLAIEQVRESFGEAVAKMVRDVNRLQAFSQVSRGQADAQQEENLRRLLLGMTDDVRAILVMLACRLQTMRNLKHAPESERRQVAAQTQRLHAPLANRLGVWQLKWELEDLRCVSLSQTPTIRSPVTWKASARNGSPSSRR